jgi:hypothetical protein
MHTVYRTEEWTTIRTSREIERGRHTKTMGARTGTALRTLKFFLRAVQFACAAIILSLFSYFLATLANHNLPTASWIRAVEAISGSAVLYVVLSVVAAIWFASATVRPLSALVSLTLDASFSIAFIYVAAANKGGSGSCTGYVETPFGNGDADTGVVTGTGGWTALPSLRQACQMQTACLAVAVVGLYVLPPLLDLGWYTDGLLFPFPDSSSSSPSSPSSLSSATAGGRAVTTPVP